MDTLTATDKAPIVSLLDRVPLSGVRATASS